MNTCETLVVGAGPVGLFLAAELVKAGHTPVIVDRLPAPTGLSKALGVQGGGAALLEARGIAAALRERATPGLKGGLHFSGIPLAEPASFLFVLQTHVEAVLEAHLASLGVRVRRGVELVGIETGADHVDATLRDVEGERVVRTRWLVGCDGGRSAVRQHAGIAFPGTEPTMLLRLGDVRLPDAKPGELAFFGEGRAPFVPLGDGYFRVITREPWTPDVVRDAPFVIDELAASVRRTYGRDVPMHDARWLSRFTDASRQAATYRAGPVLLAGDAAHTHLPAGGPGISTGLNDAANLAWRLAAVIGGHHDDAWLDDYTRERHAAGAQVLQHTRAQGALMQPNEHARALRSLMTELLALPDARRLIARRVQGLDVRYGDDPSPLVGSWMSAPIAMPVPCFVLLRPRDLAFDNVWGARLDVRDTDGPPLLIRPDGFIAWAGAGDVHEAARHWLGRN